MVGTRQGPDAPRSLSGLWEELPGGSGALELHFTRSKFKSSGAMEQGGPGREQGTGRGSEKGKTTGKDARAGRLACAPLI